MLLQDALSELGLETKPPQTVVEVKRAFQKLALNHHPDHNPDDPKASAKFNKIYKAYQIVLVHVQELNIDEEPTRVVDDPKPNNPPSPGSTTSSTNQKKQNEFWDFAEQVNQVSGFRPPQKLSLSFYQFAFGARLKKAVYIFKDCQPCKKKGYFGKTPPLLCTYCFGMGRIWIPHQKGANQKICTSCYGLGRMIENRCDQCHGFGNIRIKKRGTLIVPAGLAIKPENQLEFFLNPNTSQTLNFQIEVKEHAVFEKRGFDLIADYPIFFEQLKNQGFFYFPGLWGQIQTPFRAGLMNNSIIEINDQGLAKKSSHLKKGRLKLRLHMLSDELTVQKKQKKIYEKVALNNPNYPKLGWLRKVKIKLEL